MNNSNIEWNKLNDYLTRCELAVTHLMNGRRITVELAFLSQNQVNPQKWMTDLSNAIHMHFYDPEAEYSPEYKVSVLVNQGKAIASAKHVG